ncbi:hypothetical protein FOZ60_009857 [Perkinsus olseni]|uniref:Reverse transcriptase domain-containing protein n=1 Tax=Perkinsus olseni TaxID=32597 RepID=A0A7J6PNZ6_PEROL|nr:hypothetical protein FOZ60_009857 [Perkinsus olseni]
MNSVVDGSAGKDGDLGYFCYGHRYGSYCDYYYRRLPPPLRLLLRLLLSTTTTTTTAPIVTITIDDYHHHYGSYCDYYYRRLPPPLRLLLRLLLSTTTTTTTTPIATITIDDYHHHYGSYCDYYYRRLPPPLRLLLRLLLSTTTTTTTAPIATITIDDYHHHYGSYCDYYYRRLPPPLRLLSQGGWPSQEEEQGKEQGCGVWATRRVEEKLRSVDLEAEDAFKDNVGLYMAQLFAFKSEEVANRRAQRIKLLQELAESKAQRERERTRSACGSGGRELGVRRGTGNRPERVASGHTAGMVPNPPRAASAGRQRGTRSEERRAESRAVNREASQGEEAGWTQRSNPKHLLVTTLSSRLQGVPEGRRWPNLSNEDYDTCLKKMQEAALMEEGAQWRILGMWRTSFGLAIELGDRGTLQDILRAPPPGLSVKELAQKSCELSISDIPLALANEQGLRRRSLEGMGFQRMSHGKSGGGKDALYIGATRVRVRPHHYTRVCFVCAGRHPESWASTEGLHTEEPAGFAEDLWALRMQRAWLHGGKGRQVARKGARRNRSFSREDDEGVLAIAVEEFQRAGVLAVLIQEPPAGTPVRCGAYDIGVPYKVDTAAEDYVTVEVRPPGWGRWIKLTSLYLGRDKALEQSCSWCSRAPSRQHQNQYDRESWRRGAEIDRWADSENLRCVNVNMASSWGKASRNAAQKGRMSWTWPFPATMKPLGSVSRHQGTKGGDGQEAGTVKGRRNPKRTNWEKFIEHIDKCISGTEIRDAEELERRAGQLQRRLKDAVRLSTRRKTAGRPGSKNWWNEDLEKLRRTYPEGREARHARTPGCQPWQRAEVEARRALLKGIKQRKRDAARKAIEAMDEGAVKRWAKPRALQEWFDAEQAMDYFVGPATAGVDRREGSANHHGEEANHGPTFEMEMETFRRLLAATPRGRAPGDDECAYEHVRYAAENSSNFRGEIWEVMKASVQLGVFPRAFKPVRLVLIPKPSKGSGPGERPSREPVEEMASDIAAQGFGQGSGEGRSTVTGIKAMRDWIEEGPKRCRQGFTGMLLEDVTGAFDHCRWQNVEAAGRVVTLANSSGEHATRLRTKGVSQGSGLSPRLFVLDSCGMVDEIKKAHQEDENNPDAPKYDINVIMYADDLCVGAAKAWAEREGFSLAEAKEELWVGGGDLTRALIGDRLPELRGKIKEEAERSLEEAGKALKRYTPLCRRQFGLSEAVLEGLWHRARYAWYTKKAESLRHAAGRLMWRALGSTPGILMARVMEWKRVDHAVVERLAKATLYKRRWRLEDKDAKWLSQYAGDVLRNQQPDRGAGSHRLPDWCTVHQSELKGIERACIRAETTLPKRAGTYSCWGGQGASARAAVIRLTEKLEEAGGELRLNGRSAQRKTADSTSPVGAHKGADTKEVRVERRQGLGKEEQRRVIKAAHLSPIDRRRLMEVISGHSVTRRHWCKIDRNLGPECRFCGAEIEDERHIIFECRRFALERIRLKRRLGWRSLPYHIGNFLYSPSRLRVLMGFLRRVWPALEGQDAAATPAAARGDSMH